MTRVRMVVLLLAVAATVAAQEIEESDLFYSDPVNLTRIVDEARIAIDAGRPEAAEAALGGVIEAARDGTAPRHREVLADALALRARVRAENRRTKAATTDLEEAFKLDPARPIDPGSARRFSRLLSDVRRRLIGRLSVDSVPPGATVKVDDRNVGQTPVVDAPVLRGQRYVDVTRPGFVPAAAEVRIGTRETARLSVVLERSHSTFLLLTNAGDATVTLGDRVLGRTRRPTDEQIEAWIASFNAPIDPYDPPAALLWREAVPGEHMMRLDAPCRRPLERAVIIPAGLDSTTIAPMEPAYGSLRVEGPIDYSVSLDGGAEEPLPMTRTDLCGGSHLIAVRAPDGRNSRASVRVHEGATTTWRAGLKPILLVLGAAPDVVDRLRASRRFNVVGDVPELTAEPTAIHTSAGVDRNAHDTLVAAWGAALVAWTRGSGADRELLLLATQSTRAEILPARSPEAIDRVVDALDRPLTLEAPDIGLTLVSTHLSRHMIVATIDPAGPAPAAGVRPGDELVTIDERPLRTTADLATVLAVGGDALALELRRPTGPATATVSPVTRTVDLEPGAGGASRNVAVARLAALVASNEVDARERALARHGLGRALLELGDPNAAYSELVAIDLAVLPDDQIARTYLLRARAAAAIGDYGAARRDLERCLARPAARLLDSDGPPLLPLARAFLLTLPSPDDN